MNKLKISFTLKQHTPLIHFQANQIKATIRATELKPKFDKFLKKYVFNGNIPNEYKIDKEKDALNYKVKITSNKQSNNILFKSYLSSKDKKMDVREGAYFGKNRGVELSDIKIEFFSFNNKILKLIKEHFENFLLITNFGARQNKGFGSFSVDRDYSKTEVKERISNYKEIITTFPSSNPLKDIKDIYQLAKSGNRRSRSKLMLYFKKENKRWEKRWIKRRLYELSQKDKNAKKLFKDLIDEYHKPNRWDFKDNEKYFYIRILLGFSNTLTFLTYSAKEKKGKESEELKIKVSIRDNKKEIERFQSPVFFKVIDNNVFVFCEKNKIIPSVLKEKRFLFVASYKNDSSKVFLGDLATLDISDEKIIKVFKYIFNKTSHEKKNKNKEIFNNPFSQLKANR